MKKQLLTIALLAGVLTASAGVNLVVSGQQQQSFAVGDIGKITFTESTMDVYGKDSGKIGTFSLSDITKLFFSDKEGNVTEINPDGMLKFSKSGNILKVDGLIAIIMAVAAYAGQDVLKIHLKDGSTQTIAVSAIDSLTFEQMQSAGTFSVVDLTTKSVELKFVPAKTLGAFNIGVIKASDLNAFANDEAFCADQAKKFDADAKSWDMSLSEYLDFSLYKGNEIDDTKTFPYSDLEEGTEYVAYAYGVNTADGTANTTVEKFTFTTESLLELDFKLSTSDLSAKSGIINTNPTDANATYYIGYVTADAYTKDFGGDDQTLLNNAVGTINTNLAMGGTFDAVAKKGAMRSLMSGLTPNTAYYAIAFGIKKHKANTVYNTTPLQKLAFTTPGFEVTDNCTFGIATENIQAMLFDVKVTPSNADTRYYVALMAT